MKQIISKSRENTFKLGKEFAKKLKQGDVVGLIGELGSGKTVFTKGVAEGLGIDPMDVTSPTFTIINEYEGNLKLFHFDLYRINSIDELEALGYEEYFYNKGVVVIEWAEKCIDVLPSGSYLIYFEYIDENKRKLEFSRKTE